MKKTLFSKPYILVILVGGFSLSSCLKDSRFVDFSKVGTLVELPLAAANGLGNTVPAALPILTTPQIIPVVVNVASPKPLSTALSVTLAVDQAALTAYNHANGLDTGASPSPYIMPPSAAYSISTLTVTIPANQREASLNVSVNSSLLDPSAKYILPISIVSASGQRISQYKTILLNIQAKNAYDGIYTNTGYVHRDADLTLGGPIKAGVTVPLATTGANSVSFSQDWANGSIAGGLNPLNIVVTPGTNVLTVSSQINASVTTQTGYPSRYDPAKKTFYLAIIWNGSDPNHRSAVDTLVYQGPR